MDEVKKICIKCGEDKPLSDYHIRKDKKDGRVNICKGCYSDYHKKYYSKNTDKKKQYGKEYLQRNKDNKRQYNQKYREQNHERLLVYYRDYAKNNREKINKRYNEKIKRDSIFRLNHNVKTAIKISLKKDKAGRHWEDIVGYTIHDLKQHLERQFLKGMSWENYGQWHIDHIIPLSIFNITGIKSKGFKKAWALQNLRPLWASDNYKKNAKLFAA